MTDVLLLLLSLCMGLILGLLYFGGLWLTVHHLPKTRHPVRLTLGSLFLRMGITVISFAQVMDGHWERLLVCLLAFVWIRNRMVKACT